MKGKRKHSKPISRMDAHARLEQSTANECPICYYDVNINAVVCSACKRTIHNECVSDEGDTCKDCARSCVEGNE